MVKEEALSSCEVSKPLLAPLMGNWAKGDAASATPEQKHKTAHYEEVRSPGLNLEVSADYLQEYVTPLNDREDQST